MNVKQYKNNRERRIVKIRATLKGTAKSPRLVIFRSNRFMYAQLIDDTKGQTLLTVSDLALKLKGTKTQKSQALGEALAKIAEEKGIKSAVFDRRGYRYHGRVKALADGARKGGLQF